MTTFPEEINANWTQGHWLLQRAEHARQFADRTGREIEKLTAALQGALAQVERDTRTGEGYRYLVQLWADKHAKGSLPDVPKPGLAESMHSSTPQVAPMDSP